MKIALIYAYECTPYHRPGSTIGAQRPYQFAKHLSNFGWNAIVLCCDFSKRYSLDPTKDWQAIVKEEIEIALKKWDKSQGLVIALPSLREADRIDRVWLDSVHLDNTKGTFTPKPGLWLSLQRKITTLIKLFRGDHSQAWQMVAIYAVEILRQKGLNLSIQLAEHGPDASLYIAHHIYQKWGIPYINDFRDPILQPIPGIIRPLYRRFLNQKLLKFSQALINVNPYWVKCDQLDFGKPTYIITNGYDKSEFKGTIERPEIFTLAYFGNISFPTNLQPFFEGLQLFVKASPRKKFIFQYRGNGYKQIKDLALQYEVNDFVDANAAIAREQAIQLMRQANLLLLFSIDAEQQHDIYLKEGYYPGKVFEYFATQNPIMTIPGDNGILDKLLKKHGFLDIASTKGEVREILANHYEAWKRNNPIESIMRDNDTSIYTRQYQVESLAKILENHFQSSVSTCVE